MRPPCRDQRQGIWVHLSKEGLTGVLLGCLGCPQHGASSGPREHAIAEQIKENTSLASMSMICGTPCHRMQGSGCCGCSLWWMLDWMGLIQQGSSSDQSRGLFQQGRGGRHSPPFQNSCLATYYLANKELSAHQVTALISDSVGLAMTCQRLDWMAVISSITDGTVSIAICRGSAPLPHHQNHCGQ